MAHFYKGIEIPESSTELYENSAKFEALFGPDSFYLGANPIDQSLFAKGWTGEANEAFFYAAKDVHLTLSPKVVIHPRLISDRVDDVAARAKNPALQAAYEFLRTNRNRYPTSWDVRNARGSGADVCLLSAGGFLFIGTPGMEDLLLLSQREGDGNKGRWQEPSGLMSGPLAGAREIAEEITLHMQAPGGINSYYRVPDADGVLGFETIDRLKEPQRARLEAECRKLNEKRPEGLKLSRAMNFASHSAPLQSPASFGLPATEVRLFNDKGEEIRDERFYGFAGFETATHTFAMRGVYGISIGQRDWATPIDGEYGRAMKFYSRKAMAAGLKRHKGFALCATSAAAQEIMDSGLWPKTEAARHAIDRRFGPGRSGPHQ